MQLSPKLSIISTKLCTPALLLIFLLTYREPVPKDKRKKLFSLSEIVASFFNSFNTNLDGLFYPIPPSIKEKYSY